MNSGENKLKTAKETIEDFVAKLDEFTNETNTKFASFREEFLLYANMSQSKMNELNQQELFDVAFLLYSYASYIQDQINRQKVVYDLCNDQLQKMVARNNERFGPYTKHEAKMQLIVVDNEYANAIDGYKQIACARIQELDGKVYELKRKADILTEKGKRL
jgi:hypothetical protein